MNLLRYFLKEPLSIIKVKDSYNKTSIKASRDLLKSTQNIASRIWKMNVSIIGIRPHRIGNEVKILYILFSHI